jgi:predicted TIM-barrel enzyme
MDARRQLVTTLFHAPRALIGMLHVGPLPGSPGHRSEPTSLDGQIARAVAEAEAYRAAGFHGWGPRWWRRWP